MIGILDWHFWQIIAKGAVYREFHRESLCGYSSMGYFDNDIIFKHFPCNRYFHVANANVAGIFRRLSPNFQVVVTASFWVVLVEISRSIR